MKPQTYDYPSPGCYIDESAGSPADCNVRTIEFAQAYGFNVNLSACEDDPDYSQIASEIADDAVSFLNDLEDRPYMYWQFEDNSLFLVCDIDQAKENCEFVSNKSQDYPDDDFSGEWLHVSDHGNATLYVRENGKDREIWAVV